MSIANDNVQDAVNDENVSSKANVQRNEHKECESLLTYKQIQEIMSSDGAIVKAVLLKADGKAVEIDYNTTPRLRHADEIICGSPTFIGQWEELDVFLVKNRESNGDVNTHKLRWPFTNERVNGDILCYRIDENANGLDFTLEEYDVFAAKFEEDANRPPINIEIEDEETPAAFELPSNIDQMVEATVRRQFTEMHSREPTDEELTDLLAEIKQKFFDSDFDEDDVPQNEDDESENRSHLLDEELADITEESFKSEFDEALNHIRSLGAFDREQILANAREKIVELQKTDDSIDINMLTDAFDLLRDQLISGDNDDDEVNDSNDTDSNGEEKTDEICLPDDIEKIQREVEEALSHVRMLGNYDGRLLANRLAETFYETNGREAETEELHGIFSRLKASLEAEATDEIFDNIHDGHENTHHNAGNDNNEPEQKTECEENIVVVSTELKQKAVDHFMSLTGRKPTEQELNDVLMSIASNSFEDDHNSDEDYQPTIEDEAYENAIENELLLEHEQMCAEFVVDNLNDDRNEVRIDINNVDLPQTVARNVFETACHKLESITNRPVTETDINHIIEHLEHINLEENRFTIENESMLIDDENDSDYIPDQDELENDTDDVDFEVNVDDDNMKTVETGADDNTNTSDCA